MNRMVRWIQINQFVTVCLAKKMRMAAKADNIWSLMNQRKALLTLEISGSL